MGLGAYEKRSLSQWGTLTACFMIGDKEVGKLLKQHKPALLPKAEVLPTSCLNS